MSINLLENSPLSVTALAIRTCWDSHSKSDNGGDIDRELINRVGNKFKHRSTLSHLIMNFSFSDFSINLLEEIRENRYINISYNRENINNSIYTNGIMTINIRSILDMLEIKKSNYLLRNYFLMNLEKHIPKDFKYLLESAYSEFKGDSIDINKDFKIYSNGVIWNKNSFIAKYPTIINGEYFVEELGLFYNDIYSKYYNKKGVDSE